MAATPVPTLHFAPACVDCGFREVQLPESLPAVGDDFDWLVRDYDGFRLFMLEEMAARFPERRRWTPADMEVVIVETLSVVLDQLSDMLDRVHREAFLETARQPQSVRRLLAMIGYDAVALADARARIPEPTAPSGEEPGEQKERLSAFHTPFRRHLAELGKRILNAREKANLAPETVAGDAGITQQELSGLENGASFDVTNLLDVLKTLGLSNEFSLALDELTPTQLSNLQSFIDDPGSATGAILNTVQEFLENAPQFVARSRNEALHRYWTLYPHAMDAARSAGPRAIHTQKRMVTINDYAERLEDHPQVLRAQASSRWTGSWGTISAAVILRNNVILDEPLTATTAGGAEALAVLRKEIDDFNRDRGMEKLDWTADPNSRTVLRPYLDAYRMTGQEVFLQDAEFVGINISLSVQVASNYFQSEVRREILNALGAGLGGFFSPGRLQFGEDLHASDVIETVMALDGVNAVCLNRFKRVGQRYADQSDAGRIQIDGLEVAVCDNNLQRPERGLLRIVIHGGQRG